ncbi:hypothetical protein Bpfe_031402 [Biomphalaria pfeifferi]|uniref:Uncharacterized protein n=1 Tax=Biomphalaria pfeifferi TaxID=112525 RepID=A0AAD8EU08_BIOPF|nr:hypothetical protein Bpfe_031402 [Biomphalaria pfeifferi]
MDMHVSLQQQLYILLRSAPRLHSHDLVCGTGSARDPDGTLRHSKNLCDESRQLFVCFVVYRRCIYLKLVSSLTATITSASLTSLISVHLAFGLALTDILSPALPML